MWWSHDHLEPLDDVAVVSGGREDRVSPSSVTSRQSPAQSSLLNDVVGLDEQIIHLTVQIHWDSNRSPFSCESDLMVYISVPSHTQ